MTTKYGKYIITRPKTDMVTADREQGLANMISRVAFMDDEAIKGAFYLSCAWYLKPFPKPRPEAHTHDFDEVLGFFGSNLEDPSDLCGEIDLWLDDEKHTLTRSCAVFVPKGLKHCPMIVRKVDRPIFHFSTGPGGMYAMKKK